MRSGRLSWRDGVATILVATAVVLYVVWMIGAENPTTSETRVVGAVVLGFGFAASFVSVVFGIGAGLFRAPKTYLLIASLIGLGALISGVMALVRGSEAMLAALVAATVVLWLISTVRHLITGEQGDQRPAIGGPLEGAARG